MQSVASGVHDEVMRKHHRASRDTAEIGTGRLEAFSDGVMAVIITIMAFDLKAPLGPDFSDLRRRLPALLIYVLSFTFIGIYWNNHHHLLRATAADHRGRHVGEPAPALLALADSRAHGVGGELLQPHVAGRRLRHGGSRRRSRTPCS